MDAYIIIVGETYRMGKITSSHYRIKLSRYGLKPDRPFCAAVLADLHNRVYHSDIDAVASAVREEGCSMVFSAGDLIVMKAGIFATDQALGLIGKLTSDLPVYMANGNHETRMKRLRPDEYHRYTENLRELGAVNLINETVSVSTCGAKFHISGLELERKYYKHARGAILDPEVIREKVGDRQPDAFNILLAHHPRYFDSYVQWGADLTLSGHLHGGIVRLPWIGGVIGPDPSLFPRYDHGQYKKGRSKMIVSAGLGTHTINLRINNPAELVFIHFAE